MSSITNIRIVGVGGQGILLASSLLSEALLHSGHDVKTTEIHGMAQRGGSVFTDVRFGPRVYSPLIPEGSVDILVALELLEAGRHVGSLREDGTALISKQSIPPLAVALGAADYPDDLIDRIGAVVRAVEVIDALDLARKAGNVRTANTVVLGALSRHLEVSPGVWAEALRARLGARLLEVNLRAFELGRAGDAGRDSQGEPVTS